ncbi:MAG: MBOAT family O-acyltransferase [Clostridia bacterium]|nr:MBOAT family O-acyltransferase [Clostridia bacterium]
MVFSSYKFIFLFFPIVFGVYCALRKMKQLTPMKVWLAAASLFFYGSGDMRFFPILMFTAVYNFIISHFLQRDGVKKPVRILLMILGIAENLGLLFYFKYRNFFFENVNMVFGTHFEMLKIILPLGISFYTFQIISYLADSYSGDAKKYSFIDYMVFVTFFPQLIVGPVVSHDQIMPQLSRENLMKTDSKNIMLGILLFAIGCFKKTVIADPLITHAQTYYNGSDISGIFNSWSAVLAYTFAYYFDFSGYIDMALGLGRFFNIELPQNFNSPYKARNFADFWRRWNITVSNFLEDNIFKRIFHFGNGKIKLIFATLITFIVSGLWHGAGWHYIFWGLANGILVCCANIMTLYRKRLPFPLAWGLTFFFSVLVRVLFDALSTAQALQVYKAMFTLPSLSSLAAQWSAYLSGNKSIIFLLIFSAVIVFGFKNTGELAEDFTPKIRHAVFAGALMAVSLFCMGGVSNFLYFQF